MRTTLMISATVAALALAAAAPAKPLKTEQFKANAAVQLDSSRAYLLVRSPGMDLKLLRVPDAAEREAYAAERAEALAKARAKYPRALEQYKRDLADYRTAVKRGLPNYTKPEFPAEPADDNLKFRAIESDNFATVWAGRVFDKAGPRTTHLIAVPPGTYRIYGQILEAPNGSASGYCLCMGSVQFDAAPGTITDMGTVRHPIAEARGDKVDPQWNGLTPGKGGLTPMRIEPATGTDYVPPRLASMPRVAASYRAAGKVDNFFGVMVERLTPLEGVLAYRRDEVLDPKTGAPVTE